MTTGKTGTAQYFVGQPGGFIDLRHGGKADCADCGCARQGHPVRKIRFVAGTCYLANKDDTVEGITLAGFEQVKTDKPAYAQACRIQYEEQDPGTRQTAHSAAPRQAACAESADDAAYDQRTRRGLRAAVSAHIPPDV